MVKDNRTLAADSDFSLDDIVILDVLGEGTMFRVYKARRGTKYISLKVPIVESAMSVEMLRREYELCSTLQHRACLTTLGFEEQTPVGAAIVQEYIEGVPLDRYLEGGISTTKREALLKDLIDGVDYLHHRGISHNDLKPSNILVNGRGALRIIDFGLSSSDDSVFNGCVGGSAYYSSPERLAGKPLAGPSSDIFSLGRLIGLIFGTKRYSAVVRRCTEVQPEARYESIAELRKGLAKSRLKPFVIAGAVALLAVVVAIVAPHLYSMRQAQVFEAQKEHSREFLDSLFEATYTIAKRQEYLEFAGMAKGEFLMQSTEYMKGVPEEERFATEVVFVEYVARFDSLIYALPSIDILPKREYEAILDIFGRREYPR